MKVYLAAPISLKNEMQLWRRLIEESGRHPVVSRWIDIKSLSPFPYDDPRNFERFALNGLMDIEDVMASDVIVCYSAHIEGRQGGRDWECGMGFNAGKGIILVGPRRIVFHALIPSERVVNTVEDAIQVLDRMQDAWDTQPGTRT